jgi:hypothetical protein
MRRTQVATEIQQDGVCTAETAQTTLSQRQCAQQEAAASAVEQGCHT